MHQLNNRGWGYGAMIAFLAVFALAIIIVSILAYHMGMGNQVKIG